MQSLIKKKKSQAASSVVGSRFADLLGQVSGFFGFQFLTLAMNKNGDYCCLLAQNREALLH
jgi:hypothetical protein